MNACQAFTGQDVEAVEGPPAERAADLRRRAAEDRGPRTLYDVSIDQYRNRRRVEALVQHPPKLGSSEISDPTVGPTFGPGAILNRNALTSGTAIGAGLLLTFFRDRKQVTIGGTRPQGQDDPALQSKVVALGRRVLGRLSGELDAAAFVMGPPDGHAGGDRYLSPCRLLTSDAIGAALGRPIDTTSIAAQYAEGTNHGAEAESISGHTVLATLNGS